MRDGLYTSLLGCEKIRNGTSLVKGRKSYFWNCFKGTHLRLLDLEGIGGAGSGLEGGSSMPILGDLNLLQCCIDNMPIFGAQIATMQFSLAQNTFLLIEV